MIESNITRWRRAVAGDLTSAFDFKSPNDATVPLPSTIAYVPPDNRKHPDYSPVPPTEQALPVQEPGTRPARAVPYELHIRESINLSNGTVEIHFGNSGKTAAVFQVRAGNGKNGPWTYTVGPNDEVSDSWAFTASGQSAYDLSVYAPNGFLRVFKGSFSGEGKVNVRINPSYNIQNGGITLDVNNPSAVPITEVRIFDPYTNQTCTFALEPGERLSRRWPLEESFSWYDLTVEMDSDSSFQRRLAGHVETGRDSRSDPAIGVSK